MFNEQRRRHFPMPDYEIDMLNKEVGVTIYGNTINEKYTQLLKDNDTLTLEDCILFGCGAERTSHFRGECTRFIEQRTIRGGYIRV